MRLHETSISVDRSSFRYHYLCRYLSLSAGADTLSRSLTKFKRGAQPDLDAWIDYARETLAEKPPPHGSILLRALGHRELTAYGAFPTPHLETNALNTRPSPLDLLCHTLALDFGCRYLPTLLSKSRQTICNKGLTRPERETELLDVYSADFTRLPAPDQTFPDHPSPVDPHHPSPDDPIPPILLIDDILTTGATLRAIIIALRRASATCPIRVFTLARALNSPLPHQFTPLHTRNYHFEPQSGWSRAAPAPTPPISPSPTSTPAFPPNGS